ncbi:hypothetical protein ACFCV8_23835 [Streptomyces sp. NPDC056347]|uniref:hypothetical protein n=1 Tax=Streptomyces sp. NPDC056347 TaxID=3345790 RepID=UPI0035E0D04F
MGMDTGQWMPAAARERWAEAEFLETGAEDLPFADGDRADERLAEQRRRAEAGRFLIAIPLFVASASAGAVRPPASEAVRGLRGTYATGHHE